MPWFRRSRESAPLPGVLHDEEAIARIHELFSKPPTPLESRFAEHYGTEPSDIFKRIASLIATFTPDPAVIYYPGSNIDLSFAKYYSHSRVIHVDNMDGVAEELREGGYEAYAADHNQFVPDTPANVTIILNAGHIPNDHLRQVTATDGLVAVNNYHWAATYMRDQCPDFRFLGAVANNLELVTNFDLQELGSLPGPNDIEWPPYADTVFGFQRTH